jgi:hypothetical protein
MSNRVPSYVAAAAADPKLASESALMSAVNFYSDDLHPDAVQAASEELVNRGGDPDFYFGIDRELVVY